MRVLDLIDELAAAERNFGEFVAPILTTSRKVVARVAGLAKTFDLRRRPDDPAEGFLLLGPRGAYECIILRAATRAERQAYLEALPRVRLVLVDEDMGLPVGEAEARWGLRGPQRIGLGEGQLFETVQARFDGLNVWFEQIVERKLARALRRAFEETPSPEAIRAVPGLTPAHRAAVELLCQRAEDRQHNWQEERLRRSLDHAGGATLLEWQERPDHLWVRWEVDGQVHTSAIIPDSLEVISAGICLSGEDRHFDLTSLVSVMREGTRGYWREGEGGG